MATWSQWFEALIAIIIFLGLFKKNEGNSKWGGEKSFLKPQDSSFKILVIMNTHCSDTGPHEATLNYL